MTGQKSERLSSKHRETVEGCVGKGSRLTCSDILEATGGGLLRGDTEVSFEGLSTDSRTLKGGEVFLALKGEHFDGHDFLPDALKRGAAGVIVERTNLTDTMADPFDTRPFIAVSETLRALGDLARFWRDRFSVPVIGVTGSNGKTSTKEMIAFLLEERLRVLKSPGNFKKGLVIANPPYGKRMGEKESLESLYHRLGERLKTGFNGWKGSVFTANPDLAKHMGLRAKKQYRFYNGALPCKLLNFEIHDSLHMGKTSPPDVLSRERRSQVPDSGAEMFANRLRKNQKIIGK